MEKRLKLAYVVPALFYPSGMERVLTAKVNYFVQHFNYDIHIFLTDGKEKTPYYPLDPRIKIYHLDINFDGIFVLPLLKRLFRYRMKQRLFKKRLEERLKELKPDITVSLLRRDINFINKLSDGSLKIGELHFNRLFYRQFKDDRFPLFVQKAISEIWQQQLIRNLKKLAAFVVLSHEDAGYWVELNNVTVIHNPLSFYPDKVSSLDCKQVIAAGRLTHQKGFDRLVAAWKIVADRHPDWILKIYGGGDEEPLLRMITDLDIGNSCQLEGNVVDITEKYVESSIFALSSRYEGLPMVLGEAMACGLPVVSFDCPCGPRDIIRDGEVGLLVENGNIAQLADKICYLIEHEDIRKEMGSAARVHAKQFDIKIIAEQWKQLFNSVL